MNLESKTGILKELDRKAIAVANLCRIIFDAKDTEPLQTRSALNAYLNAANTQFPEQVAVLDTLIKLTIEADKMYEEDPENEDRGQLELEMLDLKKETTFLRNIRSMVAHLDNRSTQVEAIRNDSNRLDQIMGSKKSDVKRVVYRPFSIAFIIERSSNSYFQNHPAIGGVHFTDTLFHTIPDGSGGDKEETLESLLGYHPFGSRTEADLEKLIKHEETHAILDGVDAIENTIPANIIRKRFREYTASAKLPGYFRNGTRNSLLNTKANDLLDTLHEEILAVAGTAQSGEITISGSEIMTDLIRASLLGRRKRYSKTNEFAWIASRFATAGVRAMELIRYLQEENPSDPEIRDFFGRLSENFASLFIHNIKIAEESLRIAGVLQNGSYENVIALLTILKPYQYHHLRAYMQFKHGSQKIQEAKAFIKNEKRKTRRVKKSNFYQGAHPLHLEVCKG